MKTAKTKFLRCLGIESTAHTFGVSVVSGPDEGTVLSDVREVYKPLSGAGIHPREAALRHSQVASRLVREALDQAKTGIRGIDCISFAMGPGLGPCLRVGAVVARTLARYFGKPLVPVNHAVGHLELGSLLTGARDPIVLLVSGGHTAITAFSSGRWRIFGETLDITAGQLVDQFGRYLGYSSPAGPQIETMAQKSSNYVALPYTVKGNDVSFSGMLTAAKDLHDAGTDPDDVAYSIQETAFSMLTEVTERALAFTQKKEVLLAGGVAANQRLQEMLAKMCDGQGVKFYAVPIKYTGDCGAQIAWTGLLAYSCGDVIDVMDSVVRQSWRIDRVEIPWRN